VEKLVNFTNETDILLEFHQSGSVKMARDATGVAQVEWEIREGQALGLDIRPIEGDELSERAPWARTDGVLAMWITPVISFSNRVRCHRSTPRRRGHRGSPCSRRRPSLVWNGRAAAGELRE
jgi:hypothetical protein